MFILEEIISYCDKVRDTLMRHNNSRSEFNNDLDFQEVCAFRAIQIGELVNSLSDTFKNSHSEMPWRNIVAFRNIVTHDYGKVDADKMWDTIKDDIPTLRDFCVEQLSV